MRVKVLHKVETDFRPFDPLRDRLELVDDYQIQGARSANPDELVAPGIQLMAYREGQATDEEILELIFRDQNAVDGSERNVMMRNRSLSVGDVVDLDGRAYAVDQVGFKRLPN
jgi:hypothetical protein